MTTVRKALMSTVWLPRISSTDKAEGAIPDLLQILFTARSLAIGRVRRTLLCARSLFATVELTHTAAILALWAWEVEGDGAIGSGPASPPLPAAGIAEHPRPALTSNAAFAASVQFLSDLQIL